MTNKTFYYIYNIKTKNIELQDKKIKKEKLGVVYKLNSNRLSLWLDKKDITKAEKIFKEYMKDTLKNIKTFISTTQKKQEKREKPLVWFTDIDDTLIHSKRKIKDTSDYIVVEELNKKPQSFMSKYNFNTFLRINEEIPVIPVTTRSHNQYKRLDFLSEQGFAIIDNGATILVDGKPDKKWANYINLSYEKEDLLELEKKLTKDHHIKIRNYDGFYLVINKNKNLPALEFSGYTTYYTERKIYIVPNKINKESAVKYLIENYFKEYSIVTSGDSSMDTEFVKLGNHQLMKKGNTFIYKTHK